MPRSSDISRIIEVTVRKEWGRILAPLTKTLGDLQLAEDCLQDAAESALHHWGKNGLPNSPAAWLIQTARRKAIDRLRRAKNFSEKEKEISYLMELDASDAANDHLEHPETTIPDKRLEMIFTCCHPAIEEKSRLALTLRTIGGLTTEEIARAFLDRTEAMAARLTRAKKKIALAKIPYEIPARNALPQRLGSVLDTIYLIFNEGYSATSADSLIRTELSGEAMRLAALLNGLMPDQPETAGLHALMLLHDSRRPARLDERGNIIPLDNQNRNLWDHEKIATGKAILAKALKHGKIGRFQLQAAISACHCDAPDWLSTDWPQIFALYDLLYSIEPTPVVRLNQIYALSNAKGCEVALPALDDIEHELSDYKPFYATKAAILKQSGNFPAARTAFKRAIELSGNQSEKDFLIRALDELSGK